MSTRERRKRRTKARRVYLRFTEQEYCLIQRICVLEGKCVADLLEEWAEARAHELARQDWGLAQWWADERYRIALEETNVDSPR